MNTLLKTVATVMFLGGLILVTRPDYLFWRDSIGAAMVILGLDLIITSHDEHKS